MININCLLLVFTLLLCSLSFFTPNVDAVSNSEIRNFFQNESTLLASSAACKNDLKSLCGNEDVLNNNFEILNCIAKHSDEEIKLSSDCQHQMWRFKYKITNTNHFTSITKTICKSLLISNQDCFDAEKEDVLSPGANIVSCLIDRIQPDTNFDCLTYLKDMQLIIFSDYRLVHKLTNNCEAHINEFKCGRLDISNDEKSTHSQTNTIECLQEHLEKLSLLCKHEILRISELQSDDFHLDKPLFFACRSDREKFCKTVSSGNGRIYKCLMQNKQENEMSEDCKNKLLQRELLIVQDYKVSKTLVQSCRSDIKRYQCREGTSDKREIRLAQILLCLENAYTKNLPISTDCYSEILLHRRSLLEDYKLTPNLVNACQKDIDEFCSNLEKGAKILHCLMKYSKTKRHRGDAHVKKRISSKCQREVEVLLKEVNVAQDWRVDPVLQEACQSTVNTLCKDIKPGNGRILSCLAEYIESSLMTDECRRSLLQMQYFVVRNFELDTQVYESCHSDAVKYCHAKPDWYDEQDHMDPERGPTVMACLYRNVYHRDESVQLNKECIHHVKRIMKQRATNVELLPFIEEPCIQDLAKFCSFDDSVNKKGYEMECLQQNYEKLHIDCREAIGNFTMAQSSHFELNSPILRHCSSLAKELCSQEFENFYDDDQGELMDCLIRYKNTYQVKNNRKCKAALEHYQLINLKDFRFDSKFKEACKSDVVNYCANVHTKNDIVNCLSTLVYNDTISNNNNKRRVSKECKNLLRVELLQINENFDFDPNMAAACKYDRQQYCSDVEPGESHLLECLKSNLAKLKKACQHQLYRKQYIELVDNSVDYSLLSICKGAIDKYCFTVDLHDVLYCLRDHRRDHGIGNNCRVLILKRLLHQNQDYRLNPRLKGGCKKEIKKYCSEIIINRNPEELLDGKVISCLKKQYLLGLLSQSCEAEIVNIIREVSLNIELDPILFRKCQKEIGKNCADTLDVQECLKSKFLQKRINDIACKQQVARLIKEIEADIESDPHLYNVCVQDLKTFCGDVISGGGQQLNCLKAIQRTSPRKLTQECDTLLLKRLQLFEYAAEVYPSDSVVKVIEIVANSPIHNSLYSILASLLLFFFMIGIYCGRMTRRVASSDKIK